MTGNTPHLAPRLQRRGQPKERIKMGITIMKRMRSKIRIKIRRRGGWVT
jgi:hypothetical protein